MSTASLSSSGESSEPPSTSLDCQDLTAQPLSEAWSEQSIQLHKSQLLPKNKDHRRIPERRKILLAEAPRPLGGPPQAQLQAIQTKLKQPQQPGGRERTSHSAMLHESLSQNIRSTGYPSIEHVSVPPEDKRRIEQNRSPTLQYEKTFPEQQQSQQSRIPENILQKWAHLLEPTPIDPRQQHQMQRKRKRELELQLQKDEQHQGNLDTLTGCARRATAEHPQQISMTSACTAAGQKWHDEEGQRHHILSFDDPTKTHVSIPGHSTNAYMLGSKVEPFQSFTPPDKGAVCLGSLGGDNPSKSGSMLRMEALAPTRQLSIHSRSRSTNALSTPSSKSEHLAKNGSALNAAAGHLFANCEASRDQSELQNEPQQQRQSRLVLHKQQRDTTEMSPISASANASSGPAQQIKEQQEMTEHSTLSCPVTISSGSDCIDYNESPSSKFPLSPTLIPPSVLACFVSEPPIAPESDKGGLFPGRPKVRHAPSGMWSPQDALDHITRARGYFQRRIRAEEASYDILPSRLQLASYGPELIKAVQTQNVEVFSRMLFAGLSNNPCNHFRDSILDFVCKQGNYPIFQAMVEHGVDLRVCDGFGRTPLHHCCWSSTFCQEIADAIIEQDWHQLFIQDKQGQTPLEYVRTEIASEWIAFLESTKNKWFPFGGMAPPFTRLSRGVRLPDPDKALPLELAASLSRGDVGLDGEKLLLADIQR